MRDAITWLLFPAVMGTALFGGAAVLEAGVDPVLVVMVGAFSAAMVIIVFERIHPHIPDWSRPRGDVLTGLIAALLGQGVEPVAAARAGAFLHGEAGDLAAERVGEVSLIASDLVVALPEAVMRLQSDGETT